MQILVCVAHCRFKRFLNKVYTVDLLPAHFEDDFILFVNVAEKVFRDLNFVGVQVKGNFHGYKLLFCNFAANNAISIVSRLEIRVK